MSADPTVELDGTGVSGRDEITPATAGRLYTCQECAAAGTQPTHARTCKRLGASQIWASEDAAAARKAAADLSAAERAYWVVPTTDHAAYDAARVRMDDARRTAAHKLLLLLDEINRQAGAL
jgi:hypothetical protein